MTTPPDRTIRELVNDLYRRLDIAGRPRCAEARVLEQIGLAADALQGERDAERRCRKAFEIRLSGVQVGLTDQHIRDIGRACGVHDVLPEEATILAREGPPNGQA